jgi:hypothetical protein
VSKKRARIIGHAAQELERNCQFIVEKNAMRAYNHPHTSVGGVVGTSADDAGGHNFLARIT